MALVALAAIVWLVTVIRQHRAQGGETAEAAKHEA
jgi:hypothetical protein